MQGELIEREPRLAAVVDKQTGANLLEPASGGVVAVSFLPGTPKDFVLSVENGFEGAVELSIVCDEPWLVSETAELSLLGGESKACTFTIRPGGDGHFANIVFSWEGLSTSFVQSVAVVRKPRKAGSTLSERWARLRLVKTNAITIVLDVSESAAPHIDEIFGMARKLIGNPLDGIRRTLFFLGNDRPYSPYELDLRGGEWLSSNAGRLSIVSPVFEHVRPEPGGKVVIIGAGPIYDWEDWLDDPIMQQTVVANLGDIPHARESVAEVVPVSEFDSFCKRICLHPVRAAIVGTGLIPLAWDNQAYSARFDGEQVVLASEEATGLDVIVRFESPAPADARAQLVMADGNVACVELDDIPPVEFPEETVAHLVPAAQEAFLAARQRQAFRCPHCEQSHAWHTVYCPEEGDERGPSVLGIPCSDHARFVLLREQASGVSACTYPGNVLRRPDGNVVMLEDGRTTVYAFNAVCDSWNVARDQHFEPYLHVENDTYAIAL